MRRLQAAARQEPAGSSRGRQGVPGLHAARAVLCALRGADLAAGPLDVPQDGVVQQGKTLRVPQRLCTFQKGQGCSNSALGQAAPRMWRRGGQRPARSRGTWLGGPPAMRSSPAAASRASVTMYSTALATCGGSEGRSQLARTMGGSARSRAAATPAHLDACIRIFAPCSTPHVPHT